jgi:hypothetical protein
MFSCFEVFTSEKNQDNHARSTYHCANQFIHPHFHRFWCIHITITKDRNCMRGLFFTAAIGFQSASPLYICSRTAVNNGFNSYVLKSLCNFYDLNGIVIPT